MPFMDWKRCGNTPYWKFQDPASGFTLFINIGQGLMLGWRPYPGNKVSVQTIQLSENIPPQLMNELLGSLNPAFHDWLDDLNAVIASIGGTDAYPQTLNKWLADLPKEERNRHLTYFMGMLAKIAETIYSTAPALGPLVVEESIAPRKSLDKILEQFNILECD